MRTLTSYRQEFSFNLNQYNKTDDPDKRAEFARAMARYIAGAARDGYSREEVIGGKSYPAEIVDQFVGQVEPDTPPEAAAEQINTKIAATVDSSNVLRIGEEAPRSTRMDTPVCPDRLKIGYATGDVIQRIADQIYTSTPDKPVLYLEIRTDDCRALERAIHAVLQFRGRKIRGGGDEWFEVTDEVLNIYRFVGGHET